jgi:hypothetical protein
MFNSNFMRSCLLALCVLGLIACGSRISSSNFEKIQTDMAITEVNAILGEPTESNSVNIGPVSGTQSTWKSDQCTISIQFINGKVKAKQFFKAADEK